MGDARCGVWRVRRGGVQLLLERAALRPTAGDDGTSYLMPETGSSDDGGGGTSDASDAPSCNIPAAATYSYDGGAGGFNCYPVGQDPTNCDAKSYLVRCLASDPYNNPPMLTTSLHCGTSMPTSMSAETEWCCACQ